MVEIFDGRLEITNPGEPLVDTQRFIDLPPRTRNESLAAMMRRMQIGEEAGTGIDKVVSAIEAAHLPAPNFTVPPGSTRVFLYGQRKYAEMDSKDRIRACYQHACLCFVTGQMMTNASLRNRLGVEQQNYAAVSRIIRDTIKETLIRPFDAETSKRYMKYVPFWA
jgi:predicted HTH transcriptional regulator